MLGGANVNHMQTISTEISLEKQWYNVTGFMMTSWHRNTFCIAWPLWREFADVFCVFNMNKLLDKQSNCRWIVTTWGLCDVIAMGFASFSVACRLYPTEYSFVVLFVVILLDQDDSYVIVIHALQGCTMMKSSNGNIFRVTGEFPSQRSVTRSFDVFFDLCLNKPLSKQWWGWWFETQSRPLWRHCSA